MKSSYASRAPGRAYAWVSTGLGALLLLLALVLPDSAQAGALERGFECLQWVDLPCAVKAAESAPAGPTTDLLRSRVAFHQGDFALAGELSGGLLDRIAEIELDSVRPLMPGRVSIPLEQVSDGRIARYRSIGVPFPEPDAELIGFVLELGHGPEQDFEVLRAWVEQEHDLIQATLNATQGLVVTTMGPVDVLHHPGIERILVEQAAQAITQARERIAPLLGGPVPGQVRVEIYPDRQNFVAATGLPPESVNTTGVVAISKWNRLILLSPRAMGEGYGWRDTLVHEWVHLVVSYNSKDRAPIWLQEGLAKGTEMLWRQDSFELEVSKQSLLAGALKSGEWVSFSQMHPSMAFLPSPEMAALAYAQVATMVEYLQVSTDRQVLARVIERVRTGQDAQEALAAEANGGDFELFEQQWRSWLATLELIGEKVAIGLVGEHIEGGPEALGVEEGAQDVGFDPVLSRRKDLANRARLGELMAEQGQHQAAVGYFEQAMPEGEPASPTVVLGLARSMVALGQVAQARELLAENLRYYPEDARTQKLYAQLLLEQGKGQAAMTAYAASAEVNPFDLEVQRALVKLYADSGQLERSQSHARIVDVLAYKTL